MEITAEMPMSSAVKTKTTKLNGTKKAGSNGNGTHKLVPTEFSKQTYLDWYEMMLRIRLFEDHIYAVHGDADASRGFLHVYNGQEAIAAGLSSAIRKEDGIVTAYRQHGIGLSRGLTSRECMAELYGKVTGCVQGKGGSMHFFSRQHRYFGGNGIVGAQIPIGTGIAFAEKYLGTDLLCVTMFGDGAARQGALYEAFNMAMTWKLPVLYICENNGYAMGTSVERTSNVTDLYKLGASFEMPSEQIDGMNPESVHEGLARAAAHIRAGKGPYYLEIKTYRYRGHSKSDAASYRSKEEVEAYRQIDPVKTLPLRIVSQKIASQAEIDAIKVRIEAEIADAIDFAKTSAYPDGALLFENNYVEENYPFMKD